MKEEDKDKILRRFTPCCDFITQNYPKGVDLVFGKVFRYSSMSAGKCVAARDRISKELKIDPSTFDTKIEILEVNGVVIDETPTLRNHPHTYTINMEKFTEQSGLFEEGIKLTVLKPPTKGKSSTTSEDSSTTSEDSDTGHSNIQHEDIQYLGEDLANNSKEENQDYHLIASSGAGAPLKLLDESVIDENNTILNSRNRHQIFSTKDRLEGFAYTQPSNLLNNRLQDTLVYEIIIVNTYHISWRSDKTKSWE